MGEIEVGLLILEMGLFQAIINSSTWLSEEVVESSGWRRSFMLRSSGKLRLVVWMP